MKKTIEKLNCTFLSTKLAIKNFVSDKRGDTNFISIAIILVVVIVIAVLFITLGQDLGAKLQQKINDLMSALG